MNAVALLGSVGLYIHVPFCATRCTYCDFYRLTTSDPPVVGRYLQALSMQVAALRARLAADGGQVSSVYVGGGTPSVLGAELAQLIANLVGTLPIVAGAEVTVECNPDDITNPLVTALVDAGVNRFSLGVQALNDHTLTTFGRRHDSAVASAAITTLVASGARVSVDILAGIPDVTDTEFTEWLETVAGLGVGHVSIYPLSVEADTPLCGAIERGEQPEPNPDSAARQMELAEQVLGRLGLARYEIANYARPGQESTHNLSYWTRADYIGLGPSAASMLNIGGRTRFTLHETLEAFLADPTPERPATTESLTTADARREDVMLGLRLAAGVSSEQIERAGVLAIVDALVSEGLLTRDRSGTVRTTRRGWLLGNEVFARILFD